MAQQGRSTKSIIRFNAGELSPLMDALIDVDKYNSGCLHLENGKILPYGGIEGRKGFQLISEAKYIDKKCALLDFQFSTSTTFVLEMGDLYMRFHSNGTPVTLADVAISGATKADPCVITATGHLFSDGDFIDVSGVVGMTELNGRRFKVANKTANTFELQDNSGVDVDSTGYTTYSSGGIANEVAEISSPYLEDELFQVQYAQISDVAYFTHPNHPVRKLSRLSDSDWTFDEVEFNTPPLLDENLSTTTITPSAITGSGITLTASSAIFKNNHIGSYWKVSHTRGAASESIALTAVDVTGTSIKVKGQWNLVTTTDAGGGAWKNDILLERSRDNEVTWEVIRRYVGDKDRNIDIEGTETEEVFLRLRTENSAAYTGGNHKARLEATEAFVDGLAKVTGFTSSTVVTADVVSDFHEATASKFWAEGAWSDYRGYPKTVTLFEQRVIYAGAGSGSNYKPQTIWGTVIGDFENFQTGTDDTDSFTYTLGARERNSIEWIASHKALIIGTSGGEWIMSSGSDERPITPTNVIVRRNSTYGSNNVAAKNVNDVVLFIQRQGLKVREFANVSESVDPRVFKAPDLTRLAEHVTSGGIIQTAYQQQPDSIYWAVTGDGELIGLTYEREENVVGWHRHTTDGLIESVAVIYGDSGDELWISVKRTIGGVDRRYIERFNPLVMATKEDAFYVDSGLTLDNPIVITAATKADPVVITATGHGFLDKDIVDIRDVSGMTELNGNRYRINYLDANSFELRDAFDGTADGANIDGTAFTTYISSGTVRKVVTEVGGLFHLEGKEVEPNGNGSVQPLKTVTNGKITLSPGASIVHAGLPFETTIQPMRLDVDGGIGVSQGQKKRIIEVVIRVKDTIGFSVSNGDSEDNISFRDTTMETDTSPNLFTGDKDIKWFAGSSRNPKIIIKQKQAYPITLLAIIIKYAVTEK